MARRPVFAVLVLVAAFVGGCGSPPPPSNGPKNAKEKQRLEAKAEEPTMKPPPGKKWSGWRYQGDRNECFFVVGRRCFKTQKSACEAAECGAKKCEIDGGGPAIVSCAK